MKKMKLSEEEKILYQTTGQTNRVGRNFCFYLFFIGIFIGLVFYSMTVEEYKLLAILFIPIPFGCMGLILWDVVLREYTFDFYITTNRVIKAKVDYIFPILLKPTEFRLNNIAYINRYSGKIYIVQKGPNGELHYNGEETTHIWKKPKKSKRIVIILNDPKGKKTLKEIVNKLVDLIQARKHPNLDYVYLNKV